MPSRRLTLTVLPHTGVNFFCSLILLRIFDNTHPKRRSKKNINGDDNFSPPPPHFPFPFTAEEDNLISVPAWKTRDFLPIFVLFLLRKVPTKKSVFCGEITVRWIMVRKWDASGTSCPSDGIAPSSSSFSKKTSIKSTFCPHAWHHHYGWETPQEAEWKTVCEATEFRLGQRNRVCRIYV